MIITKLAIKGLHGVYNYTINFNDDLTLIYGENGCGKTTILDIASSIVTGKLYNLFSYKFDEISLAYRKSRRSKLNRINIITVGDAYDVTLNDGEMNETIKDIRNVKDIYARDEDEVAFDRRFISTYEIPSYIRKTFKYIYLPLSRNSQDGIDINDANYYRRRKALMYAERDFVNKNYLNDSLRYVEDIVRSGCMRISTAENIINAKFRRNILMSSLKVTSEYNANYFLFGPNVKKNALTDIEKSKDEYIRTLESIGEWNTDTSEQVEPFFAKYKKAYEQLQQGDDQSKNRITIELLLMNSEFNKIKEIASQAQQIEAEKAEARTSKTTFLNIVNDFLNIGEEKKNVSISNEGKIIIEVNNTHRRLSLYDLSSGEKQIIIIFACLTFGLPTEQSGIYIVDEPEASLHLSWQKHFVESILKTKSTIQFIFATHSPEIIGRYTDRAVKLVKTVANTKMIEDESDEEC